MTDLPNKTLLRPDEVAEYLRISKRTVYLWIDMGKLEAVKLPGKTIRIRRASIQEMEKTGGD